MNAPGEMRVGTQDKNASCVSQEALRTACPGTDTTLGPYTRIKDHQTRSGWLLTGTSYMGRLHSHRFFFGFLHASICAAEVGQFGGKIDVNNGRLDQAYLQV